MSETPEHDAGVPDEPGEREHAGEYQDREAREGAGDPEDPAARAQAAAAAREAGDPRPESQIEAENLAAAEVPRDLRQPDVPVDQLRTAERESAHRYADDGIAGAPGSEADPGAPGGSTLPLSGHQDPEAAEAAPGATGTGVVPGPGEEDPAGGF